jgi:pimeloyl-ACP methyl ester carboxylesterase
MSKHATLAPAAALEVAERRLFARAR